MFSQPLRLSFFPFFIFVWKIRATTTTKSNNCKENIFHSVLRSYDVIEIDWMKYFFMNLWKARTAGLYKAGKYCCFRDWHDWFSFLLYWIFYKTLIEFYKFILISSSFQFFFFFSSCFCRRNFLWNILIPSEGLFRQ